MNKIFKVIWNPATGCYSVASETAKSRGKKSGRSKLLISALVAGGLLSSFGALANAGNDTGTGVDHGNGYYGLGWVALGLGAEADTYNDDNGASTAVGYNAKASKKWATAIGALTQAGEASLAVGNLANASAARSISLGASSIAAGGYSIALGTEAVSNGTRSIAQGAKAVSTGNYSIAIGDHSNTGADKAIALGNATKATAIMSIALGDSANASKEYSMALGASSKANGTDSLALGRLSLASATNAIAMGAETEAAENATAIGFNADAIGKSSLALGDNASANDTNAIAIGQGSEADKVGSIALGSNSKSAGENAIALGNSTNAGGKNSLAFGFGANANGDNAVAIGANSSAGADNTVSVGSSSLKRKIVNMDKGDINNVSTDAINGSQLYAISKSVSDRLGGYHDDPDNVINSDGKLKAPTFYLQSGQYNNVGEALQSIDNNTLHWDEKNKKYSASHTVFNADGTTRSVQAQSIITNVADGTISDSSFDAVNGSQLKATQDDVDANTTSITNLSNDVAGNTTNITNLQDAVDGLSDDALQWDSGKTAFSAKHGANATSKITNVTAGDLTAGSTDAVNGSQLYNFSSAIADYLGGGSSVDANGMFSAPTYTIGGTDYDSVGDALAAINSSVGTSLGDALMWDNSSRTFSASRAGTASKITNVAAGELSATSTDVVNGSQLYGVSNSVVDALGGGSTMNADGTINAPTYTIANTDYSNIGDALGALDASMDDALVWDSATNAFSAAHGADTTSKITNVAAGALSATSTDAVNGSQLYGVSNSVVDALGGGSTMNADGTINAPTYSIANTDYSNIGDALSAIDASLDDSLLWDASAGAFSAAHGTDTASKITNVANGRIAADSTDAVNGSQLFTTNQMITQIAGNTSNTYVEEHGAGVNYIRTNDTGLVFEDASASGIGATAVGYNSVASATGSVAIGQDSSSNVESGVALGSGSVSNRVIVKGSRNTSITENGVVIGYDTTDGELLGALSIGDDGKYRQIINVADGSEAHDAVTVRQLQNAIGSVATTPTKYYHANSTAEDSLAVGEDSLAIGAKTIVNGDAGIGIGLNTLVLADAINGIAIGSNAHANHANSIAMGNGSETTRGAQTGYTAYNMDAPQNSVGEFSVGSEDGQRQITNVAAGSQDTDAVNVGQLKVTDAQVAQNTQSITNLNTQVGNLDTRVTTLENGMGDIITTGSTKYFKANTTGVDANAQGKDSVAIGSGSIAAADNSVALGTGSEANEENTVSVGSSTNQRRITNVAAGKNDTDAVNVAQLKSSEAGSVRYDTKSDGSVDYSNISLGDGKGGTTRISNVSAGVNNNDAVNYAQLKQSVQETKQYTDQRMVEMDNKLSKTESKLSGGIASAMAMTGLPQAYTPGASMTSIGGGTYNGESAVALGVSMVSANGRWVYKLQGSTNSQGEYSAAIGAGIQW
ncbi:YadA-like family protein [Escherichia albertii]|uniref:YadA-like family protein n=2 Tax=Escherichia albertii TaxID=208962 RepID=UPI00074362EE|nr:YadA-like family protein [Escherichia albertii]